MKTGISNFEIRELTVGDWEIYKSIRLCSLKDSPDSFGSTYEREVPFAECDWRSRLESQPGHNVLPLVAEIENEPVGLASGLIWESEPKVAHVFQMWVAPEKRGQGIAKAMIENIIGWAEARGCESLALSVTTVNKAATNLYQASGFLPSGSLEPLREGSALAVQPMSKKLDRTASIRIPFETVLETRRLLLRSVNILDSDVVWEASRFDGFNDGMVWDPPSCREELAEIAQRNIDSWLNGTDYVFTVCLGAADVPIGRVGLHQKDAADVWNIGFWIHPHHWGHGFAPEAARAVLDFALDRLKARKVVTSHAIWNKRSEAVIRRLGFDYVRENPEGFWKSGRPVAEHEYELRFSANGEIEDFR